MEAAQNLSQEKQTQVRSSFTTIQRRGIHVRFSTRWGGFHLGHTQQQIYKVNLGSEGARDSFSSPPPNF